MKQPTYFGFLLFYLKVVGIFTPDNLNLTWKFVFFIYRAFVFLFLLKLYILALLSVFKEFDDSFIQNMTVNFCNIEIATKILIFLIKPKLVKRLIYGAHEKFDQQRTDEDFKEIIEKNEKNNWILCNGFAVSAQVKYRRFFTFILHRISEVLKWHLQILIFEVGF